ncbi:MAG: hypothetical protein ACYTHM_19560 [Planctomycetota bacterium]|jgi:hypothetical protein
MGLHSKSLSIFAACILSAAWVWAGEGSLDREAASAPGRDRFPDADAIILKEVRTVTLDGDGKRTERFYRLVKILTPLGSRWFADPRFPFDEGGGHALQWSQYRHAQGPCQDSRLCHPP